MAKGSAPADARRRSLPLIEDVAVPEDCTTCGTCCWSSSPTYIAVFEADRTRMDEVAIASTVIIDGRRYMRFANGRCTSLVSRGGLHTCAIYPMRPDACRWLQRGSGTCIEMLGDKPASV